MTFEDRVHTLEPFGFTPRQTRFLATVALHSGYCLRRQYSAFASVRYGKNVCDFLDKLVERQLAERFTQRADRGIIYHLKARAIYRALGQSENRNRRAASAALIARKIMVLDYVLGHRDLDWLATEQDKVDLFVERYGVPLADLPQQAFPASKPGVAGTTRFFTHKLPVAVAGDPPVAHFVYLTTDGTGRGFEQFLADHARLVAWLPAWTVIAIGVSAAALATCETVFSRSRGLPPATATARLEDLRWFFATRQVIDLGQWARLAVAELDRFRTLRDRFSAETFEALYDSWRHEGDSVLATYGQVAGQPRARSVGYLVTERLPFDYSQFGSLPGIA